jgi:hypothetical protein
MIQLETMVSNWSGGVGRPAKHRRAIARAFVAKAVFNLNATRQLLDRLSVDVSLRRLCGWESRGEIPHESQFSRAFAEFAASELPQRLHEALIKATQQERLIGHISRDSTEIEGREKPLRTPVAAVPVKPIRKRGRPKKGEQPLPPEPTRLERQAGMTLEQMLDDLPRACNAGSKNNSKGYKETWIGYKLHLDVADGQIPISCILTSASLHDSQAAIPLARLTAQRVTHLYDLMDSAYDAQSIHEQIRGLGADTDHRCPSAPRFGTEGGVTSRSETAQAAELQLCRGRALSGTYHREAGERALEGRVRRAHDPRARQRQGDVPSDVRHRRAGRRSDTEAHHVGSQEKAENLDQDRILTVAACPKIEILMAAASKYRPNGVALHRQVTPTGENFASLRIVGGA